MTEKCDLCQSELPLDGCEICNWLPRINKDIKQDVKNILDPDKKPPITYWRHYIKRYWLCDLCWKYHSWRCDT
jgi:hypothetical protein